MSSSTSEAPGGPSAPSQLTSSPASTVSAVPLPLSPSSKPAGMLYRPPHKRDSADDGKRASGGCDGGEPQRSPALTAATTPLTMAARLRGPLPPPSSSSSPSPATTTVAVVSTGPESAGGHGGATAASLPSGSDKTRLPASYLAAARGGATGSAGSSPALPPTSSPAHGSPGVAGKDESSTVSPTRPAPSSLDVAAPPSEEHHGESVVDGTPVLKKSAAKRKKKAAKMAAKLESEREAAALLAQMHQPLPGDESNDLPRAETDALATTAAPAAPKEKKKKKKKNKAGAAAATGATTTASATTPPNINLSIGPYNNNNNNNSNNNNNILMSAGNGMNHPDLMAMMDAGFPSSSPQQQQQMFFYPPHLTQHQHHQQQQQQQGSPTVPMQYYMPQNAAAASGIHPHPYAMYGMGNGAASVMFHQPHLGHPLHGSPTGRRGQGSNYSSGGPAITSLVFPGVPAPEVGGVASTAAGPSPSADGGEEGGLPSPASRTPLTGPLLLQRGYYPASKGGGEGSSGPSSSPPPADGSGAGGGGGRSGSGSMLPHHHHHHHHFHVNRPVPNSSSGGGAEGPHKVSERPLPTRSPSAAAASPTLHNHAVSMMAEGGGMGAGTPQAATPTSRSPPVQLTLEQQQMQRLAMLRQGGIQIPFPSMAAEPPLPDYDFFSILPVYVKNCLTLSEEDQHVREHLCWGIQAVAKRALQRSAEVRVHGSVTTGLALPSSDVDLLVIGYQPQLPLDALKALSDALLAVDQDTLDADVARQEEMEAEEAVDKADAATTPTTAADGETTQPPAMKKQNSAERSIAEEEENGACTPNPSDAQTVTPPTASAATLSPSFMSASARRRDFSSMARELGVEEMLALDEEASATLTLDGPASALGASSPARGGGGGADGDDVAEVYDCATDVEAAEEIFRGQIEKDYSFSTSCGVAPILASSTVMAPRRAAEETGHAQRKKRRVRDSDSDSDDEHEEDEEDDEDEEEDYDSDMYSRPSGPSIASSIVDEKEIEAQEPTQDIPETEETNACTREEEEKGAAIVADDERDEKKQTEELLSTPSPDLPPPPQQQQAQAQAVAPAVVPPHGLRHLTFVPVLEGPLFLTQTITSTRVPVIKLTDKATGTKVDITFAGGEHWRSMKLTRTLLEQFPQAKPLILMLKQCVRCRGIGESEPGGVTSFALYLMVLHFYHHCVARVADMLREQEEAMMMAAAAEEEEGACEGEGEREEHGQESADDKKEVDDGGVGEEKKKRVETRGGGEGSGVHAVALPLLEQMVSSYLTYAMQRHRPAMDSAAAATNLPQNNEENEEGNKNQQESEKEEKQVALSVDSIRATIMSFLQQQNEENTNAAAPLSSTGAAAPATKLAMRPLSSSSSTAAMAALAKPSSGELTSAGEEEGESAGPTANLPLHTHHAIKEVGPQQYEHLHNNNNNGADQNEEEEAEKETQNRNTNNRDENHIDAVEGGATPTRLRSPSDPKLAPSTSSSTSPASPASPDAPHALEDVAKSLLRDKATLTDLFIDFCRYYGCSFDYEHYGIRFSLDGRSEVVAKPFICARRGQHFHMTSPFDAEYDLTARMTHMRDFQWLCWCFTEWAVARQQYYYSGVGGGACSLSYILQWLSPQTAMADLQAVTQAVLMEEERAGESGGYGGGPEELAAAARGGSGPGMMQEQGYGTAAAGLTAPSSVPVSVQQQQQQHAALAAMAAMAATANYYYGGYNNSTLHTGIMNHNNNNNNMNGSAYARSGPQGGGGGGRYPRPYSSASSPSSSLWSYPPQSLMQDSMQYYIAQPPQQGAGGKRGRRADKTGANPPPSSPSPTATTAAAATTTPTGNNNNNNNNNNFGFQPTMSWDASMNFMMQPYQNQHGSLSPSSSAVAATTATAGPLLSSYRPLHAPTVTVGKRRNTSGGGRGRGGGGSAGPPPRTASSTQSEGVADPDAVHNNNNNNNNSKLLSPMQENEKGKEGSGGVARSYSA